MLSGKNFRKEVNLIKKKLKNQRKPTDIIVFTDGYSFSSGAFLIKYLQYHGGAITAGYFPNQIIKKENFDSGSCASGLYSPDVIDYFELEEFKALNKLNYSMSVAGVQFFFESNDLTHPLEYAVSPVDEIVNIYPELDYLNDLLLQDDYDKFINASFKILDKYKTKCNPDNKKLLLLTNKCDGKFGNNYTHGGYKCGNNGYWTEECVPSYCDIG